MLSLKEARRLFLRSQLLANRPMFTGKSGALSVIEHLGYVQIDTISVVQRAHHHTLWSRVHNYQPKILHELQSQDRKVYEYWSHAAAYLPMKDYRFSLPRMRAYQDGERQWFRRQKKLMQDVLDRIRIEGPLKSSDFERDSKKKSGPWFDWKPAKKALQILFMEGRVMISERRGFQKVYDLPERVIPSGVDLRMPTMEEYAKHLIEATLRSSGIATEREIVYLRKGISTAVKKALEDLTEEEVIERVQLEGYRKETFYVLSRAPSDHVRLGQALENPESGLEAVHILSPFDNSVIQRKRLQKLFDFNFMIECYVPEAKRRFGYFCLPILRGENFIGRMDVKADRRSKTLIIRSLYFERGQKADERLWNDLAKAILEFAAFNQCDRVEAKDLAKSHRGALREILSRPLE